ncbi:MAG: hypothetical protein V7L31_24210 [Nostoc sp.]|uniref:hypothetical protein n=1 Tax=Nostoc sp. TaxID=1180 RepID=UPI002FF41D7F
MIKIQPLNVKNVVISGVIELFNAFRINATQAYQILEEVKQYLPIPREQDADYTANSGKEVILTILFDPGKSIDVRSQVTTAVSPMVQNSVKNT